MSIGNNFVAFYYSQDDKQPIPMSIDELYHHIKSTDGVWNQAKDMPTNKQPAYHPSGLYAQGRWIDKQNKFSYLIGYIFSNKYWDRAIKWQHTVMAYSVDNLIHVLLHCPLIATGNMTQDGQFYLYTWQYCLQQFINTKLDLHHGLDLHDGKINDLFIPTYDENIYYQPKANPIYMSAQPALAKVDTTGYEHIGLL